jgi:hypothetical protein
MEWIIVIGKLIAVVIGLTAITAGLLKLSRYDKWARAPKSELNTIPGIYTRRNAFGISRARHAARRDITIASIALVLLLILITVAVAWGPFDNLANAVLIVLAGLLTMVAFLRLGSH